MKWLVLVWGLGGPHIEGAFHSRLLCEALVEHPTTTSRAGVRACVEMDVDKLTTDMVVYHPSTEENDNEYSRSPNGPQSCTYKEPATGSHTESWAAC
jgi:hypothetical protein